MGQCQQPAPVAAAVAAAAEREAACCFLNAACSPLSCQTAASVTASASMFQLQPYTPPPWAAKISLVRSTAAAALLDARR